MFWLTLIDHVEVIDLWLEDMIEVLETGFERTWYCCNKCNIVLEEPHTTMQVIEAAIKAPDRCRARYLFPTRVAFSGYTFS